MNSLFSYKVAGLRRFKETEQIDYEELQKIAEEHRPKLLVCGASAYSRIINFERIGQIARSVGARMFADTLTLPTNCCRVSSVAGAAR